MKIGIIGSGMIGATLAGLWEAAGHKVMISSRHPNTITTLAESIGHGVQVGTPTEAARFGEVVLLAVPYVATPTLGRELGEELKGKLVLDAGNPMEHRDGTIANTALSQGSAQFTADQFSGAHVVKAFNTVYFKTLQTESHRQGDKIGIPLAGADPQALETAGSLVRDAGFVPVIVGGLRDSAKFDPGTPVWGTGLGTVELRKHLGV